MTSRRFAALVLIFGLFGCGLNESEKPFKAEPIKVDKEFRCLEDVDLLMDKYLEQDLSEKQINEFFACAKQAVSDFKKFSHGASQNGERTAGEFRNFLQRNFLKEKVFTDGLLREAMQIKVVIVGGSPDVITERDLERLVEWIAILNDHAIALRPYIKVLFGEHKLQSKTESYQKQSSAAVAALKKSAKHLGQILSLNKSKYDFESMQRLLVHWAEFSEAKDDERLRSIENWVGLFKAAKGAMFDTEKEYISPNEWSFLLSNGAGWYSTFIKLQYQVKQTEVFSLEGLQYFKEFAESMINYGESVFANRKQGAVEFEEVNQLVYALEKLDLVPFGIRAETAVDIIPEYLRRAFNGFEKPLAERTLDKFYLRNFKAMRYEYELWYGVQNYLQENKTENDRVKISNEILSLNFYECIGQVNPTRYSDPRCELIRLLYQRPMFDGNHDTAYLTYKQQREWNLNFGNLSYLNVVRVATRFLIFGFGDTATRSSKNRVLNLGGITIDEFEDFYVTSKQLGIDLKIMNPDGVRVGMRSFQEAKLFTYSAKGVDLSRKNDLATYPELVELISLIYSGGRIGENSFDRLLEICGEDENKKELGYDTGGAKGAHGYDTITFQCFKNKFKDVLVQQLNSLPGMKKYISELDTAEYLKFQNSLYYIMFNPDEDYRIIEYSDLTALHTILHYIEVLITRYDSGPAGGDGKLNHPELKRSYPVFKNIFETVSGDPELAEKAFYWTLKNGKIPSELDFDMYGPKFIGWDFSDEFYNEINMDRSDLAKVFIVIGQEIQRMSEDQSPK